MDAVSPMTFQLASQAGANSASLQEPAPNPGSGSSINKRKARSQKVCQPCRLRKVKCTYEVPCRTCTDRGYPELCHYIDDEPVKRINSGLESAGADGFIQLSGEIADLRQHVSGLEGLLRSLNQEVALLRTDLSGAKPRARVSSQPDIDVAQSNSDLDMAQGISASDRLAGGPVYLGGNSVPAMVMALGTDSPEEDGAQKIISQSILPIFCLDNESATYPFVDLWGIPHGSFKRVELLCKLLPKNVDCLETFSQYRDTAHVIFPGVVDIRQFEGELLDFLQQRNTDRLAEQSGALVNQKVHGKDLHWLGLLFATLASGVQVCALPRKERQMKAQVYGLLSHPRLLAALLMQF
jgi:Fungal Zn(2)-Cys(6) binuclear cluster domain